MTLEVLLLIGSALVLVSIMLVRVSDNFGVPALLLFLLLGMLVGRESPFSVTQVETDVAQTISIIALAVILFAGGLDTHWPTVRPVVGVASRLATLGVLLTAVLVGIAATWVLGFPLITGLILGAVVSSTDAAAVFSVLRSKSVSLRGQLAPLLELESGSNDPMAVFLTIGCIQLAMNPSAGPGDLLWMFVAQMGIGGAAGVLFGRAAGPAINRIHISYEGMYPILLMAAGALIYSATASVGGSGFLAVYIAGMMIGNDDIIHKKLLLRFFDSLAWLAQISMFLVLGLLVSPSELLIVLPAGLILSAVLMFVARPGAVFATLAFDAMPVREKLFVSWVGLRGAVPIILATFPLLAEVPHAGTLFALVSFVVLTSALFQGWTIPFVARLLRVDAPLERKLRLPLDFAPATTTETELLDITVPFASPVAGQQIVDLGLPSGTLVVLISRDNQYVVPAGGTVIEGGDTLVMLVNKGCIDEVRDMLTGARKG